MCLSYHVGAKKESDAASTIYTLNATAGCIVHCYDHYSELWARMLELQAIPGKVSEKFNRRQTFAEIDELFRQEDAQAA